MVISYSGYATYRKEFMLQANAPLDFGAITMSPAPKNLDEILVVGERPPVRVYKDTIEFNAASFKTLPTALVEDLLKKLPGVEVDHEGNILVNGKQVNRILVDGKFFFGDNLRMATRNLPANIIDKVQVVDDRQEIDQSTTGNLTMVGKVINLTLKKGIKKGWFGNGYGGYGSRERNELGGIANIYRDTLQLSLLAYSNNINRGGFTVQDVFSLGGFGRSGVNSMNVVNRNGTQGFSLNGISFGGLDDGIARSSGAGFNLNHAPSKKLTFFGQYFFGNNHNVLESYRQSQQFISDTNVTAVTSSHTLKNVVTHTAAFGADINPNKFLSITFRANGQFAASKANTASQIITSNNKIGSISSGIASQLITADNGFYMHTLRATLKSRSKNGRILNFVQSFNYQNDQQNFTTIAENIYSYPARDTALTDQLRQTKVPTLLSTEELNLTEPLSKRLTLRFNNRFSYLQEEQALSIFDGMGFNGRQVRTNATNRSEHRFLSTFLLSYAANKLTVSGSVTGLYQSLTGNFQGITNKIDSRTTFLLPGLSVKWKDLSVDYGKSMDLPDFRLLSPLPDSSNPFYIVWGNPHLQLVERHTMNINYYHYSPVHNLNTNFYVRGSAIDKDVVFSRTIDEKGVQSIFPLNVNGILQLTGGIGIGKTFKNKQNTSFSLRINPSANYKQSKVIVNGNVSTAFTAGMDPRVQAGINWKNIIEFNPAYTFSMSKTTYTDRVFSELEVITHLLQADLLVHWPRKITWQSNLLSRYNNQVAPGLPKTNTLWNAAFAISLLRDQKGQLKLSIYDILNSNNSYSRYTTENQIIDQKTNVLNRYVMLTFIYSFRDMGGAPKNTSKGRLFLF
jgi:hypothetical protein